MFENNEQVARAEGVLSGGVYNGHWHATGLALVVNRLDKVVDRLDTLIDVLSEEIAPQSS